MKYTNVIYIIDFAHTDRLPAENNFGLMIWFDKGRKNNNPFGIYKDRQKH